MKNIALVIPTYNHIDDLLKCLKSINSSVDNKKYEVTVIVVDDKSSKNDRELLISNVVKFNIFKSIDVKLLFLSKNVGFMTACNAGIKSILNSEKKKKPEYVGVLHDDVIITKSWFDNIIDALEEDITTYCASSLSMNELDAYSVKSLNLEMSVEEEDKYSMIDEENLDEFASEVLKKAPLIDADAFQMYATMFKIDAFNKFGLFDDLNLTSINMENQFAKLLKDNNKKVKIAPNACVFHKSRLLSDENPYKQVYNRSVKATEFINSVNDAYTDKRRNYVIYTFVRTGESLPKIPDMNPENGYVCFTNDANLYAKRGLNFPWKMFKVDDLADFLQLQTQSIKLKEFIKLHPHLFFKNFNTSIWIDSQYDCIKDPTEIIKKIKPATFVLGLDDAYIDCAYKELIHTKKHAYMTATEFNAVLQIMKWCKYPQHNGMIDSSILVRKHNDERCQQVMNKVWNFVNNTYANDRLFLNLVLWLNKYSYSYIPANIIKTAYLKVKTNE